MTAPTLTDLKFYIITPSAATNLITNPTPYRATTGYAAGGGGAETLTLSDTYTRRGPACLKLTTVASELSRIYTAAISVVEDSVYTFSVDVKTTAGEPVYLLVAEDGGDNLETESFTATGYWQRKSVTFTATDTDVILFIVRNSTSENEYDLYADGWQLELGSSATTFFSGDTKGFDAAPLEFYWGGTPHASVSYRTADTRAGGTLLDISSYATIAGVYGLGMGNFSQIMSQIVSGGAMYQRHIRLPRNFTLKLHYFGTMDEIHGYRNTIIEAIRPDYTGYDQPMVIRYQGLDSSDDEATNPLDIICIPQIGHVDPALACAFNEDVITFTVLDSILAGAYYEGKDLSFSETESDTTSAFYKSLTGGAWTGVITGGNGLAQDSYCLAEGNDGTIYIGGLFTNGGSVAEADYLCKWDGTTIDDVTGAADFGAEVRAIAKDAAGNLYIAGDFENAGDASGDRIVKWNGSALSSLGTGMNGDVHALAIDPNTGYLYAGGAFTAAGGVANTARIARWNGSAWQALSTGISNGIVYALAFAPNGDLYIGGTFTNITGAAGDYIGYWNGSAFNMVGWVELNAYVKCIKFSESGRMYIGGNFTNAGGWFQNADYIAYWGWGWMPLGAGLDGVVHAIEIIDGVVYAGGAFTGTLKKYASGSWTAVDLSLDGTPVVYGLLHTSDDKLYVASTESGTTTSAAYETVTNNGNTLAYPIVEITGPGQLDSIENTTTGKSISFSGLTLQSGERITLNFNPTELSFTSSWSGRGNVMAYVSSESNVGSFYLKPGDNTIGVYMSTGTDANTKIYVWLRPSFWNIEGCQYE